MARLTPAVKQARLRHKLPTGTFYTHVQGIPLDPQRFQYCAKTHNALRHKCALRAGHQGPCGGDAVAIVFKGFTDEEA